MRERNGRTGARADVELGLQGDGVLLLLVLGDLSSTERAEDHQSERQATAWRPKSGLEA